MAFLIALTFIALAALFAFLIRRGFRDGDHPDDLRVTVVSIRRPRTGPGGWIEVDIANPGPLPALVSLRLLGGRLGQPRQRLPKRRAAGSGRAMSVADQLVGAVGPGQVESFRLWSEREPTEQIVRAFVGTRERLRLHTLPAARAVDLSAWDAQPLALELHH